MLFFMCFTYIHNLFDITRDEIIKLERKKETLRRGRIWKCK